MSQIQHRSKWRQFQPTPSSQNSAFQKKIKEVIQKFSPAKSIEKDGSHCRFKIMSKHQEDKINDPFSFIRQKIGSPSMKQSIQLNQSEQKQNNQFSYNSSNRILQSKGSVSEFILKDNPKSEENIQVNETIQEIKRDYLLFKKSIFEELKSYERQMRTAIQKIMEIISQQTLSASKLMNQKKPMTIDTLNRKLVESVQEEFASRALTSSKSHECLKFNHIDPVREFKIDGINITAEKIKVVRSPKASPKFDKFFQIMGRLKQTMDQTVDPHESPSQLKEIRINKLAINT